MMQSAPVNAHAQQRQQTQTQKEEEEEEEATVTPKQVLKETLLADLPTPAFVVNRHAFAKNCQGVLDLAKARSLKLRPHIKTHKAIEGVKLQQYGTCISSSSSDNTTTPTTNLVTGFVGSSIPEVELLVEYLQSSSSSSSSTDGSSDNLSILYGVPISSAKLPALAALKERLLNGNQKIHILMDHLQQISMIEDFVVMGKQQQQHAQINAAQTPWSVFVKLDTGYHRAGTTCDEHGMALVEAILKSPVLELAGLYSHCGHAYDISDQNTISNIAKNDMDLIQQFIERLEHHLPNNVLDLLTLSVGSTPSLWHHFNPAYATATATAKEEEGDNKQKKWWTAFFQRHPSVILEIHPGNYTFLDRQQLYSGAATTESSLAARVLTRVIGHYNDEYRPQTILLDAGATALTKEATPQGGMAAIASSSSLSSPAVYEEEMVVYKMSQEVSMARPKYLLAKSDNPSQQQQQQQQQQQSALEAFPLGSMLTLLPNHSCLAAACFDKYYVIDDPSCQFDPATPILEEWIPVKGW